MEAVAREPWIEIERRRVSESQKRGELVNVARDKTQVNEGLGFSLERSTETYAMMSPPRFGPDAFIPDKENLTIGKVIAAVSQFFLMGLFAAGAIAILFSTFYGAASAVAVTAQIFAWFGLSTFSVVDSAILLKLAIAPLGIFVTLTVAGAALTKALVGMWNAFDSLF